MSQNFTPPPMPGYGPPLPPPQPPKRSNNTVIIAVASAVVAAAVASAVTAGVTSDDDAKAAPTVTVTETAAEGGTASDGDTTAADEETDSGEEADDDGVFALDETVTYENDVEVDLSGLKRTTSGAYASPENTPYVAFTVKVKNGGSKTLDATMLTVNCSYGEDGKSSESIFDSEAGLNGGPDTKLLAGRSINVPWGCELPKNEKTIQIEISPDFDSEAAIYTGTVK
ncbi:hypothetical protein [Streptomyces sp. NPDC059786]|uniref:hypothetical protein n=1 Tax=Streptomyces sp. NPDC059786 TaxID=3346946 RepID=UPI0036663407